VTTPSIRDIGGWISACMTRDTRASSLWAVLAMLGASLATLSGSAALALAVSDAVAGKSAATWWMLAAIALTGVGRLLDVAKMNAYALAEFSLERALTRRVFRSTVGAQHHEAVGGQLQKLNTIVLGGRLIFQHALFTAPSAAMDALFAAVFLTLFGQPLIAGFLVGFALAYVWLAFHLAAPIGACARDMAVSRMVSAARFGDALLNRNVVRWYGALEFVAASFDSAFAQVQDDNRRLTRARTCAALWTACAFAGGYAVSLGLAWFATDDLNTRVRDVVLANMCVLTLIRPLELAAQAMRDLVLARAWIAPLAELGEPATASNWGAHQHRAGVAISVRDAAVGYGDGSLFRGASFEIAAGAVVGVRGASGAGKSSLIRVLIGDLALTGGAVAWDGSAVPPPFAIAPQDTLLLNDTISANVAFGRTVNPDAISRAVALVGLDRVLAKSGRTLSFTVGEGGRELSGGERQRVALARALAVPKPLYVLDEATSALDAKSEADVLEGLVCHRGDATIIIVSHRPGAFTLCDTVIELIDGTVAFHDRASLASADTGLRTESGDPRSSAART